MVFDNIFIGQQNATYILKISNLIEHEHFRIEYQLNN